LGRAQKVIPVDAFIVMLKNKNTRIEFLKVEIIYLWYLVRHHKYS